MALQVELVSPERILYSGEAEMVVARTIDGGEIAFLTGHAPFVGALGIGLVRIKTTVGGEQVAAVHGGFVEVRDNRVIILSDVAELATDVDVDRARRARDAAGADADAALRSSGLAWTIIRPGRLTDDPATGLVALGPDVGRGDVTRADVAAVLAAVLDEPGTIGKQWNLVNGETPVAEAVRQG